MPANYRAIFKPPLPIPNHNIPSLSVIAKGGNPFEYNMKLTIYYFSSPHGNLAPSNHTPTILTNPTVQPDF